MATYAFTGYSAADLSVAGASVSLRSDWAVANNGLTFTITDDDAYLGGDSSNPEVGNDATQTAVITDASGTVVASGRVYLEEYSLLTDGEGVSIKAYSVEIGGVVVGVVTEAALTPGVTYTAGAATNVTDADHPAYAALHNASWTPDAANSLDGGASGDSLLAGASNDSISAGGGADTAYGGTGDDWINTGSGDDLAYGGDGNDTLDGGYGGTDTLYGDAGDDALTGGDGTDALFGGEGSDGFSVDNSHQVTNVYGGSTGSDWDGVWLSTWGGAGGVTVTWSGTNAGSYSFAVTGASGTFEDIEIWAGTDYADVFNAAASTGPEYIAAHGGDDTVTGGSGADLVYGEGGADSINAGTGADTVYGGDGNDSIHGNVYGTSWTADGNDLIYGGAGADMLAADVGDDVVYGDADNDSLWGYYGADSLFGGDGSDKLYGENDADSLSGGGGTDSLYGGSGADSLEGGAGGDYLDGGTGIDFATYTGSGAGVSVNLANGLASGGDAAGDTFLGIDGIIGSAYADTLTGFDQSSTGSDAFTNVFYGAAGADLMYGAAGGDSLYGGDDGDTIYGGADADMVKGDLGDDSLAGGSGDDTIYGGSERDTLSGDAGADSLNAGWDDDTLSGGDGADTLRGGMGADTLTGGSGDDRIILEVSGGNDTVTDFDLADDDSDGKYNDQIDVTALTAPGGGPVYARHVTVTDDGSGNALLTFPGGETLVLTGVAPSQMSQIGQLMAAGIPCFAAGTRIATPDGPVPVQDLGEGDIVSTNGGPAPVLWIGDRAVSVGEMRADPRLRPVRFAAGTLGNRTAVRLSAQHGVLVIGPQGPVLVRATHLARLLPGVRVAAGARPVTYHHLLLPRHALLWAEGTACESFYPGPLALAGLTTIERIRLLARFPGLAAILRGTPPEAAYGPRVRPLATWAQARLLFDRTAQMASRHLAVVGTAPATWRHSLVTATGHGKSFSQNSAVIIDPAVANSSDEAATRLATPYRLANT